jgi:hypothetical protein
VADRRHYDVIITAVGEIQLLGEFDAEQIDAKAPSGGRRLPPEHRRGEPVAHGDRQRRSPTT